MEAEEEAITHTLERRLEMVSQAWHTVTIAAAIHYSLFAKIYLSRPALHIFLALHPSGLSGAGGRSGQAA